MYICYAEINSHNGVMNSFSYSDLLDRFSTNITHQTFAIQLVYKDKENQNTSGLHNQTLDQCMYVCMHE